MDKSSPPFHLSSDIQVNPDYTGTQISFSEVEFEKLVNKAYTEGATLVDGYAPFWYASYVDVSTNTTLFHQLSE